MPIQSPTPFATQEADMLSALQATGISQTATGGKARAFIDIVASKLNETESNQLSNLDQVLIPYATGTSLDMLGAIYGIDRLARYDAQTSVNDGNFEFYVVSGTFGSINSNKDIVIPAGTQLYALGSTVASYSITYATTLSATASSQVVAVTATTVGSFGNAPAETITQHNFSNYTDSSDGTLLVTNNFGVVSGRDTEDDDSYRYRIQLQLKSSGGASEDDIQGQLLALTGVQDVSFESLPGTFNVYIYSISSVTPPVLLQLAQSKIDQIVAFPSSGTAISPDLVGISLSTTIQVSSSTSTTDQALVIANAQTAVAAYINNIGKDGTFVINNLVSVISQSDTRIISVGQPNAPIQSIFIWRDRENGTRYSGNLVSNYTLGLGERLVVESISNPINIVIS